MIRAGTWVFVFKGFNERASDLHFESSGTETESFSFLWAEIRVDFIGVRRRRYRCFSGKIILIAIAKVGGSSWPFMICLIESLTHGTILNVEARGFGESVEHFGFGPIRGAVADLDAVGGDD